MMIRAYRLKNLKFPHARPDLWEWERPHIETLTQIARVRGHRIMQHYFRGVNALAKENTRLWEEYYRPDPLCVNWETWLEWLPGHRELMMQLLEIEVNPEEKG